MNVDAPHYANFDPSDKLQRQEPISPNARHQVNCYDCGKTLWSPLPRPLAEQGITTYYLCSACLDERTTHA